MFYPLLIFGMIIRILFIGVPGFKADIAFWKGWGLAMADKGIVWLVNNTNYNYPPGFAYILFLVNKIYALFRSPYNISEYWFDNNFLYLFLFKIITIIADLGIVFLIIKVASKFKAIKWGKLLALFYFLNPVVIFDGVIWGQVDQLGLFLFLLTLYFLIINRPKAATIFFTISFLMKFQNIIFIPLFYLYIYKSYSFEELIKSLKVSFIVFAIVIFPFWFHREMAGLFRLFTINSDWFPWYSLNAYNFWWLLSGLKGMSLSDKNLLIGIMNAKQFGLLLFSLSYLIAVFFLFVSKKEELMKNFILVSALVVFSFFHLLTQSHERYLFPVLGLLILGFIFEKKPNITKDLFFYMIVSLLIFFNMYISLADNYPDQVYWPFSKQFSQTVSLYLSYSQIAVFIYFFINYFSRLLKKYWLFLTTCLLLFISILVLKNLDYLLGKPISLTKLTPIDYKQDYLSPVNNMTVNANLGVFSWQRLSTNDYFFNQGIGSHADSTITYGLGGRFSKLRTSYGLDSEANTVARVYFIVKGDGRELFHSQVMGHFDNPKFVEIPIKNIDKLSLVILKADETNYGDHADWLEPILIR